MVQIWMKTSNRGQLLRCAPPTCFFVSIRTELAGETPLGTRASAVRRDKLQCQATYYENTFVFGTNSLQNPSAPSMGTIRLPRYV